MAKSRLGVDGVREFSCKNLWANCAWEFIILQKFSG